LAVSVGCRVALLIGDNEREAARQARRHSAPARLSGRRARRDISVRPGDGRRRGTGEVFLVLKLGRPMIQRQRLPRLSQPSVALHDGFRRRGRARHHIWAANEAALVAERVHLLVQGNRWRERLEDLRGREGGRQGFLAEGCCCSRGWCNVGAPGAPWERLVLLGCARLSTDGCTAVAPYSFDRWSALGPAS